MDVVCRPTLSNPLANLSRRHPGNRCGLYAQLHTGGQSLSMIVKYNAYRTLPVQVELSVNLKSANRLVQAITETHRLRVDGIIRGRGNITGMVRTGLEV